MPFHKQPKNVQHRGPPKTPGPHLTPAAHKQSTRPIIPEGPLRPIASVTLRTRKEQTIILHNLVGPQLEVAEVHVDRSGD
jgi:hypothetical protein